MQRYYDRVHQHKGLDSDGSPILTNPKFGNVTGGKYLEVLPDSGLAVQRGGSPYDDMNFTFSTGRVSQANFPNWETMLSPFYAYTFAINDYIQLAAQEFPHSWEEGTEAEVHVHAITNGLDTTDRYVKHQVSLTWANAYSESDHSVYDTVTVLETEITIPANTADRTHFVRSIGTLPMTGGKVGAYIGIVYKRISADGAAPTEDPFIIAVGLHIKKNTNGSIGLTGKWA